MHRFTARLGVLAATAVGALVLCGCQAQQGTRAGASSTVSMGAVNSECPVSGKPVKADAGTATWRGKTIGFCCPNCSPSWNAMSAKEKDAFVADSTGR